MPKHYLTPLSTGEKKTCKQDISAIFLGHVLKPETTKRNHRNETTETKRPKRAKQPKRNHRNERNERNETTETTETSETKRLKQIIVSLVSFRSFRSFRFGGFVSLFRVLVHAFFWYAYHFYPSRARNFMSCKSAFNMHGAR